MIQDLKALGLRLQQAADDIFSGATIFSDRVHGLLEEAADALSSKSPPQDGDEVNWELQQVGGKAFACEADYIAYVHPEAVDYIRLMFPSVNRGQAATVVKNVISALRSGRG